MRIPIESNQRMLCNAICLTDTISHFFALGIFFRNIQRKKHTSINPPYVVYLSFCRARVFGIASKIESRLSVHNAYNTIT